MPLILNNKQQDFGNTLPASLWCSWGYIQQGWEGPMIPNRLIGRLAIDHRYVHMLTSDFDLIIAISLTELSAKPEILACNWLSRTLEWYPWVKKRQSGSFVGRKPCSHIWPVLHSQDLNARPARPVMATKLRKTISFSLALSNQRIELILSFRDSSNRVQRSKTMKSIVYPDVL